MGCGCRLVVNMPKLDCDECERKLRIRFPAARSKVSYTGEFEKEVMRSLRENTVEGTARKLGVGPWIVSDILRYRVKRMIPEQDLSTVTQIFIDEIQFMNGHNCLTIFSDQDKRLIFIAQGKGADTIDEFVIRLIIQGGDPENIRVVSADMSKAFESGVMRNLPNATLVFDRFHLVRAINNDLNTVRKRTLRRNKGERLRHVKYTVLKRPENMSDKDAERLGNIRLHNPELAPAFDMKESFCEILDSADRNKALAAFKRHLCKPV
jgi:transposase